MSAIVENKKTEVVLRKILKKEGFRLRNSQRRNGETGVDIEAEKNGKKYFIEVIGFKKSPPARSKDFYEVFFRAISRLKADVDYLVIALPKRFGDGLYQRAAKYGMGWERIGQVFPELKIWLVDTEKGDYRETSWNEWLIVEKCLCAVPDCGKCLSINCKDKACLVHSKEAKKSWRLRWEVSNKKTFPHPKNY